MPEYQSGFSFFMNFGEWSQDSMGLCILGDKSNPAAHYATMAANSAEPRDCAYAKHQAVSY